MALLAGFLTSAVYFTVSVAFARGAYRVHYDRLREAQVPAVYGHGWMTHEDKKRRAFHEAMWWLAFWHLFLIWDVMYAVGGVTRTGFLRLVTGPEPAEAAIERLEKETDQLAREQDPLQGLDHTVGETTVTHSEIAAASDVQVRKIAAFQFDNSDDPWMWRDDPADKNGEDRVIAFKDNIIRTRHPEKFGPHVSCGGVRVAATTHSGVRIFLDDRGHAWED